MDRRKADTAVAFLALVAALVSPGAQTGEILRKLEIRHYEITDQEGRKPAWRS